MIFKSKLKVWLFIIVIASIISSIPGIINNYKAKKAAEDIYTTCVIDIDVDDTVLKNRVSGSMIDVAGENVKIMISSDNPDIIISENEKNKSGYVELKNYLYIPFVMVANPNLKGADQECFNKVSGNYTKYEKDIRYILKAIEEDKKWSDIGIENSSVIDNGNNKVTLIIPNDYNSAYQKIREYFILALNDYKKPDANEINELAKRVDLILEKCEKSENIASLFTKSTWFKSIIFCPESIISERHTNFKNNCMIISPGKTFRSKYNVYIKNEKLDEMKKILTSYTFLELTGYRNVVHNETTQSKYYKSTFEIFDYIDEIVTMNDQSSIPAILESASKEENSNIKTVKEVETEKESSDSTEELISETEELSQMEESETIESENNEEEESGTSLLLQFYLVVLFFLLLVLAIAAFLS